MFNEAPAFLKKKKGSVHISLNHTVLNRKSSIVDLEARNTDREEMSKSNDHLFRKINIVNIFPPTPERTRGSKL